MPLSPPSDLLRSEKLPRKSSKSTTLKASLRPRRKEKKMTITTSLSKLKRILNKKPKELKNRLKKKSTRTKT